MNFVHDKQSWDEMAFIEKAIQRNIQRIKTENFDDMERVCTLSKADYSASLTHFVGFEKDFERRKGRELSSFVTPISIIQL